MTDFELLGVVGDDRAAVHLAARADHGEHATDGDDLAIGLLEADEILVPGVLGAVDGGRQRLCVVADRPAAHGEEKVRLCRAGSFAALLQFLDGGIGHDACVLEDFLPALAQNREDGVVNSVFLYRPAAVDQEHILAVFGQLLFQPFEGVFAEVNLCRIVVNEIS